MEKNIKQKRRSHLITGAILLIALIGVLVINTDRVSADKTTATSHEVQAETATAFTDAESSGFISSAMPSLFRLISALILVIAAIYGGIYLLKKAMGKKYSGNRQLNLLEVLETTYVAPKKSVSLVRVADKAVLVGMSENQITVLTELNSEETASVMAAIDTQEQPDAFGDLLKTATRKIKEIGFKKTNQTALET